MVVVRRRVTEKEAMDGGLPCPGCGTYVSLESVAIARTCPRASRGDCDARLSLEVVVDDLDA